MAVGQTTGVRALQRFDKTRAVASGTTQESFMAEQFSTLDGGDLDTVVDGLDAQAAATQKARWLMEFSNAFALRRDFRYRMRSRRWLMTRGVQGDYDGAYAQWLQYVRQNRVVDQPATEIADEDPDRLAIRPFSDIMSTK